MIKSHRCSDLVTTDDQLPEPGVIVRHFHDTDSMGTIISVVDRMTTVIWSTAPSAVSAVHDLVVSELQDVIDDFAGQPMIARTANLLSAALGARLKTLNCDHVIHSSSKTVQYCSQQYSTEKRPSIIAKVDYIANVRLYKTITVKFKLS